MKYVVVIALVGLLLVLVYRKLRPYLIAGKDLLITIRDLKNKLRQPSSFQGQSEKLVRCEACGTWVPGARMIAGKSGKMFCSSECLKIEHVSRPSS